MKTLTSNHIQLDSSAGALGELHRPNYLLENSSILRQRLIDDGYLFLNTFFDVKEIHKIRRSILEHLSSLGVLDDNFTIDEARLKPGYHLKKVQPKIAQLPEVKNLIHNEQLHNFISIMLDGPVKPFDFIWARTVRPSLAESAHCDIIYMGRGTRNLYTTWIPMGDVSRHHGSLMVLERSHKVEQLDKYRSMDYEKDNNWKKFRFKHGTIFRGVDYSKNARKIQKEFGLRWLTSDFIAGDMLLFHTELLHATLDNNSDRIRLSLDTRFQLVSEPMDPRFVGETPLGHRIPEHLSLQDVLNRILRPAK